MPDVTISLPQPVIDAYDTMHPPGQTAEQKMAKALKEHAFAEERARSGKNVNAAARAAQDVENQRLKQVQRDFEL